MVKTIIKEIFIILLITIAVAVVLALIMYQYMPTNRIIPSKVTAYSTPEEVSKEIEDQTSEQQYEAENKIFMITDTDLSMYRSQKNYNPGKIDPFAEYSEQTEGETTQNGNNETQNVDRNTTDNYYTAANVNTGTK